MANKIKDPGFGETSNKFANRMVNADGSFNISHKNNTKRFNETYHYLINISWTKFFVLAAFSFLVVNLFFACIYMLIGIEGITKPTGNIFDDFFNAFFFSAQTLTTVGYGALSPSGVVTGLLSSFQAFVGLAMFSFLTGLIYGRFSKPKSSIRFSKHIVYRDFNHTKALMFRLVNNRTSIMIKPKVAVTLSLSKLNNVGDYVRSYYSLDLERDSITYLPTTWTIVHEITENSPLYSISKDEIIEQDGELLVMISYFDESFNQEVHQMHSYMLKDAKIDFKFVEAYHYEDDGKMVLDYDLFDKIESIKS